MSSLKPPTKRPKGIPKRKATEFFFINKDLSSASLSNNRSDRKAHSAIHRHAQRYTPAEGPGEQATFAVSRSRLVAWNQPSSPQGRPRVGTPTISPAGTPSQYDDDSASSSSDELERLSIDEENETSETFNSPLSPCIDSLSCQHGYMDFDKQLVLQYFIQVQLPWRISMPPGSHVNSFTPAWLGDVHQGSMIVSRALQSSNSLPLYCLLAVTSRRMRLLKGMSFGRRDVPEIYTVKAIQALRKSVQTADSNDDRFLLDLAYLVLAELYVRDAARIDTYFSMMRTYIASRGGLAMINSYDVFSALAVDVIVAASTFTIPALDGTKYPQLLGVTASASDTVETIRTKVAVASHRLDSNVRLMYEQNNSLISIMEAVLALPTNATLGISAYVKKGIGLFPLQSLPLSLAESKVNLDVDFQKMTATDNLYVQMRVASYQIWLWYSAIGPLTVDAQSSEVVQPPIAVEHLVKHFGRSLDRLTTSFRGSIWSSHNAMSLWFAALGCLVSSEPEYHTEYRQLFLEAVKELSIATKEELQQTLIKSLSLERINPRWLETLWAFVDPPWNSPGTTLSDVDRI